MENVTNGKNGNVVVAGDNNKWLSTGEIDFVLKQFFPPNTAKDNKDVVYCLEVARQFNLNPITKQIYFVPRRSQDDNNIWHDKIEPLVGRDGFLAIAHRTGHFGGIESSSIIKDVPKLEDGNWKMKKDLVGICKVWRTDSQMPFVVEVAYSEYVQLKKDKSPTKFWADKPDTMIKKVAESQALRKAFNISGLYSPEEVGVGIDEGGNVTIDVETYEATIIPQDENAKVVNRELDALKQFGLECEFKDGYAKVIGNTYGCNEQLKTLGYKFLPAKKIWVKKLS